MTQKVWNSLGDLNPSGKSLQGPCLEITDSPWRAAAWRGLTWASISPHTGAHPAEASPGCWWNPTGRSRRQARNLRSSLLVRTGPRTHSNSTSVRCPGLQSPIPTRPGGHAEGKGHL
uniref:Uncharacterized protein n=1 Tax=Ursus maritimus TaxID=29073 RepID=A0A452TYX7_URSMA